MALPLSGQQMMVKANVQEKANLRLDDLKLDKVAYYKNEPIIVYYNLSSIGNLPFYASVTDTIIKSSLGVFSANAKQSSFVVFPSNHLQSGNQPLTLLISYTDLLESYFSSANQFNTEILEEEPTYSDKIFISTLNNLEVGQDNTIYLRLTNLLEQDLEDVYVYSTYYGFSSLHIDKLASLQPEEYEFKVFTGLENKSLTFPIYLYSKKDNILLQNVITLPIIIPSQKASLKVTRNVITVENPSNKIFYGKIKIKQYSFFKDSSIANAEFNVNLFSYTKRNIDFEIKGDYAIVTLEDFLGNSLQQDKVRLNYLLEISVALLVLIIILAVIYFFKNSKH
jgi:hypothetical protein